MNRSEMLKLMHKFYKVYNRLQIYILPIFSIISIIPSIRNNNLFKTITLILKIFIIINIVLGVSVILYFTDFVTPLNTTYSIYNDLVEYYIELIRNLWNIIINYFNKLLNLSSSKNELESVLKDSISQLKSDVKVEVKSGMQEAIEEALHKMEEDEASRWIFTQCVLISSGLFLIYFIFILPGGGVSIEEITHYNWLNQHLINIKLSIIDLISKPTNPGNPGLPKVDVTLPKSTVDVGISPISPVISEGISTVTPNTPIIKTLSQFVEVSTQTNLNGVDVSTQTNLNGLEVGRLVGTVNVLGDVLPQQTQKTLITYVNDSIKNITD